ncbi:MAG: malto-oligosyltrehalose trehalohydrolase [Gammaproteobacteria bacterium]
MKRRHVMPFGTEMIEGGGVNFRFWAPAITAVKLQLDGAQGMPMTAVGAGWFELKVPAARNGSRYHFQLPDGLIVPDPASRFNPEDVHGPSEVIDPTAFDWSDDDWRGRPWEEAVIYELHVGSFTPTGNFGGVMERLNYLVDLGVTALEIMPVADFPGRCNWGYDGVLLFAPDAVYGRPDDFKRFIDAAHDRGLMVLLDVVYNHFGPEGNYLHTYAPVFFNSSHVTPWGAAINFDGKGSRTVRDFFIHNALYWMEEYHLDGLRLDAIHTISDDSSLDIVEELAEAIRHGPGRERNVHLVLENDRNQAHYLSRDAAGQKRYATAQWNDDFHHTLHVLASGETEGCYNDYATEPARLLGRSLAEGFVFQGEPSHFRDGVRRGEPSGHLPPTAFVSFLQTHDQVGNRAFGERLCHIISPAKLEVLTAILLLAPQPPLLFMGEEFAAAQPFLFFCDFSSKLARAVTEGRRREFSKFDRFADAAERELIPDPNAITTFTNCVLDWSALEHAHHCSTLKLYRQLLMLRRQWIVPHLAGMNSGTSQLVLLSARALSIRWRLDSHCSLSLVANFGEEDIKIDPVDGTLIFATANLSAAMLATGRMPQWSAAWHLLLESHQ